ncbi:MAG: class I SAM-dependent methyltransferase [Candidatus Binatia bacterium]
MDEDVLARYNSAEGADDYLHKFERHWTERINDWHEQRLIRRLLRSVSLIDPSRLALDLPCGYGRLYPIVRELGIPVVEGDWSFPLLAAARKIHTHRDKLKPSPNYVRATALALPFSAGAFEFVLSARLSHHIREHEQRLQHLREVLRVSRKWAMFTYFDGGSVKNRMHEFGRRFNGKRAKWTLTLEEVQRLGHAEGFAVIQWAWISRFFSGHRYVLLRRN